MHARVVTSVCTCSRARMFALAHTRVMAQLMGVPRSCLQSPAHGPTDRGGRVWAGATGAGPEGGGRRRRAQRCDQTQGGAHANQCLKAMDVIHRQGTDRIRVYNDLQRRHHGLQGHNYGMEHYCTGGLG